MNRKLMRPQYAVFRGGSASSLRDKPLFESDDPAAVYAWLKKTGELDTPGYWVLDRMTRHMWEEGIFTREYEEYQRRLNPYVEAGSHRCISEDRIRTIVREELSKFVDEVRRKTRVLEEFDAERMSDALLAVIDYQAGEAVNEHYDQDHR